MICCREAAAGCMSTKHGGKGGAIVNVVVDGGDPGRPVRIVGLRRDQRQPSIPSPGDLRREVADEGIRVNSLRPGMVLTEMTEIRLKDADFRKGIESSIPMRRVGESHEIAEAALWLPVGRSLLHHRLDDARRGRCGDIEFSIEVPSPFKWGRCPRVLRGPEGSLSLREKIDLPAAHDPSGWLWATSPFEWGGKARIFPRSAE